MAIAREAEPVGSLTEVREAGLDREDLLTIYRNMLITRGVEERGHILYRQGKIPGSFYTGRGNEGAAVGVATAMGPDDVGAPLHRDMGVHITKGLEPWRIFANYMAKEDGPTKGRDGNVHMADLRLGMISMVSHLPAMLPVAVGAALAFRIDRKSTRLNSSHMSISYAVFCLKKKTHKIDSPYSRRLELAFAPGRTGTDPRWPDCQLYLSYPWGYGWLSHPSSGTSPRQNDQTS